jgi:hypothetical protein
VRHARVDEVARVDGCFGGCTVARRGVLSATQRRHKEQRRSWNEMANEELSFNSKSRQWIRAAHMGMHKGLSERRATGQNGKVA